MAHTEHNNEATATPRASSVTTLRPIHVGIFLAVVLLAIASAFAAIPYLISGVVALVPRDAEARLGSAVVDLMAPQEQRISDSRADRAGQVLERTLLSQAGSQWSFRILWLRNDEVNALAAPGGNIVVHCGLVRALNSADQLAAVLAHEASHVTGRHAMRNLVRTAGIRVGLALVGADVFLDAVATLGALRYMRADEEAADRDGLDLMVRAGLNPGAMAQAFAHLKTGTTEVPAAIRYLATHPALEERQRWAESHAAHTKARSSFRNAMSQAEWLGLRSACAR